MRHLISNHPPPHPVIHLTDDRALLLFSLLIRGDPDSADLHGNTALIWASNNGHADCVSFLVNFGVNLWSLNNEYQTAKDVAALRMRANCPILDLLDAAMARQSALNPKSVKKMKEKALTEAERRIRTVERIHKKALKQAEKEEKEMEKKRRKLLSLPAPTASSITDTGTTTTTTTGTSTTTTASRTTTAAATSVSGRPCLTRRNLFSGIGISPDPQTQSLNGISMKQHLLESKTGPKAAALKFSDIVNRGTIRSAPKSSSLGAVSRKILHKKLHSHHSMNNLSNIPDNNASSCLISDFKVRQKLDPDSGYFSKSSVRSLSGLRRRDADVLFVKKEDHYENIYHSMNSLSLKNSSWIEMFRKKSDES
jgi:hypothetical protein